MSSSELPPSVEPERSSTGERAASYVRRLIFEGHLRPGDRVPQEAVARALGTSRIPVREGLIILQGEGWVSIELHRGAFVSTLDPDAVRDHYELFGLIYGLAAKRATQRSGEAVAEQLAPIVAAMRKTDDAEEMRRLTLAFHAAVVAAARSTRVEVHLRGMSSIIPGNFFAEVPGAIEIERRGAAAVARAIRRGDAVEASEQYQRTLQRQADRVVPVLAARGLFEAPERPSVPAGTNA
jgi:DNA-binding GntR family transcriptional regulator